VVLGQTQISLLAYGFQKLLKTAGNVSWFVLLARSFELRKREMTKPKDSRKRKKATSKPYRCAIYVRCATDLPTSASNSTANQIRKCTEYAEKQGWKIVQELVVTDVGVSGTSVVGRNGLQQLMATAKQRPRSFDLVLIADTSRLCRNLEGALRLAKMFEFNGVHIVSVGQNLDLGDQMARQLLIFSTAMDEQYFHDLAAKIRRGLEGRLLKGYAVGGRCYGYRNVPVENPRKGDYGRPLVMGVKREIVHEEAKVIRRIFEAHSEGRSLPAIAQILNAEGIPSPGHRDSSRASWRPATIRRILRNEHYRGVFIWNRTGKIRDAESGRTKITTRPQPEWVRTEAPECRIVSEDLWSKAQAERKLKLDTKKHAS
jgi:DNA invertase Pin-like site-specific DNA recombinase